jgi:hypothetical protein
MSIAHTWFGRVIVSPRSRYGQIFVAGLGFGRARTAIERLCPHPLHQRLHVTAADLAPLGHQQAAQHPRAGEGELQMQSVETRMIARSASGTGRGR